ncbi:hypothetical protein Lal_00028320 [Lupinus albus]|nr:hypothetical protein Lal_00028320 [Lupinus albus]
MRDNEGRFGDLEDYGYKGRAYQDKPNLQDSDNDQSSLSGGVHGFETVLILELKSIADVSFVGMPNFGKSTLLGAISRAKHAVGRFAFTTLRPNLGNLNYDDFSIIVADIPGLIKGAHQNRGLGYAFMRHIECTKVQDGLSNRRSLIVVNKIDEEGVEEVYKELQRRVQGATIFPVCAVLGDGIPELKAGLRLLVNSEMSSKLSLDQFFVD